MNEASTIAAIPVIESSREETKVMRVGFVFALSALVLLDGVNGGMTSTLGRYLMGRFSATPDQITWATIVYYVSKLYALLVAAKLQERVGQRRALLGSSAVLVAATFAGAFITNYPSFLGLIFIQAGAGGLVIALGQGALLMKFSRRDQPLAQTVFALANVMFPATMTPSYLGAFAYNLDWQHAYLFVIPLGLLAWGWLFLNQRMLSDDTISVPVPVLKFALMLTGLCALVYVLEQGNRNRWFESPNVVGAMFLTVLCILGVAFAETDGRPPYIPYRAFRYANFTFGFCTALIAGVAFLGGGSVISGFTGGVLSYTVLDSGLVQLGASLLTSFALVGGGLILRFTKFPGILIIYIGQIVFSFAMWKLGQAPSNMNYESIIPWLALRGFALGCQFLPITLMTLTCLPAENDIAAAGLFNLSRQLGALVGTAWLQTLREHLVDRNQTIFGNALSAVSPNAHHYSQSLQDTLASTGVSPVFASPAAMSAILHESSRQWTNIAFNGCFQALSALFLFSFPLIVLLRVVTQRYLKPPSC